MDEDVQNFMMITGSNADVAQGYLNMADGDVGQAVSLFYETPELQSSFRAQAAATSSAPAAAAPASNAPPQRTNTARSGRQDASGVIHIDSDDDDDFQMAEDDYIDVDDDDDVAQAATVARVAQEDEDAAMAKRLQEELYSEPAGGSGAAGSEDVRAPIARTTETLVAPSAGSYGMEDDDMESAIFEQLRRRRQAQPRSTNPFAQSIWDDPNAPMRAPQPAAEGIPQTRAQRLAELFRPPYDLISPFSWDEARSEGKEEKKWILVNLQDMTDFNCQALNRDIWKDDLVRQLVQENFIFLQYSKDDDRAQQYITFYFSHQARENPNNYPHVSIIDPRTGEQVKVWSGTPFPTPQEFHSQLVEFLDRYSLSVNSKNPVSKQKRPQQTVDVDRMTEEEMLQMAMQNSLESNGTGGSTPDVHDPDALTQSMELGKGKGKEVATDDDDVMEVAPPADEASSSSQPSPFTGIASDRPHTEPAHDPATTTRIQFRHPTGRVIRRFAVQDPVSRIYEWLKAEPLEGKDGIEFELKAMPQGKDLIDDLGKTIEEAGLKQGTVMIEFVE